MMRVSRRGEWIALEVMSAPISARITSDLYRKRPGTSITCMAYQLIGECMTNNDHVPEGPPLGLTPIRAVPDAHAAIAFYAQAFGATELARILAPDAKRLIHVRMVVFGTVFVFMDGIPDLAANESRFHSPDRLNGTSVSLHLQVADAESVWRQALNAGAIPITRSRSNSGANSTGG